MGALGALRQKVADALVGLDEDWTVIAGPVDAVTPPAFVLVWTDRDDWLTRSTSCVYGARLDVVVVSARVDVEGGLVILESMIEGALPALDAAGVPSTAAGPPGPFEIGGVTYQAARIRVAVPVSIGGL